MIGEQINLAIGDVSWDITGELVKTDATQQAQFTATASTVDTPDFTFVRTFTKDAFLGVVALCYEYWQGELVKRATANRPGIRS